MNLKRKLQIVEEAVRSISTHGDEDAKVISAALDRCAAIVQRELDELDERIDAEIEEKLK